MYITVSVFSLETNRLDKEFSYITMEILLNTYVGRSNRRKITGHLRASRAGIFLANSTSLYSTEFHIMSILTSKDLSIMLSGTRTIMGIL